MDSDDELQRLQEQLAAVQAQDVAHKLSERVCVEIVLKLLKRKQIDLIFTTSGREYLTPERLRREIQDEILAAGGRVSLTDLPALLSVDVGAVEDGVHAVVRSSKSLRLVGDEVLSNHYIDSAMEEVNAMLQTAGRLTLGDIAQHLQLPAEVVVSAVSARLGTIIQGHLKDNEVYTDSFVQRHNARVRGAFVAVTRPTALRVVTKRFGLLESLAYTELKRLVDEGELAGSLRGAGARSTFVPDIYTRSQEEAVDAFYSQNGFIEYDMLKRMDISQPQRFLSRRYPDALPLKSLFLSDMYLAKVVGSLEAAADSSSWLHIPALLPTQTTEPDCAEVLQRCIRTHNKTVGDASHKFHQIADQYAVSAAFLSQALDALRPRVQTWAEQAAAQQSNESAAAPKPDKVSRKRSSSTHEEDEDEDNGGGRRGKKGKKGKSKKGGKRRNKKGKRRGDDSDDEFDDDAPAQKSKGKQARKPSSRLPFEKVIAELRATFPDLDRQLVEPIAGHLRAELTVLFRDVQKSIFTGGASDRRQRHDAAVEALKEAFTAIQTFHHGALTFESGDGDDDAGDDGDDGDDDSTASALTATARKRALSVLHRFLLKTLCSQAASILIGNEAMHSNIALPAPPASGKAPDSLLPPPLSSTQQIHVVSLMEAGERKDALNTMLACLGEATSRPLIDSFESAASACGVRLKRLDRKTERQVVFGLRRGLMQQLENETRPEVVLQHVVLILHSQATGTMLHAPSRSVPAIVRFLADHIEADAFDTLRQYADAVRDIVESKRQIGDGDDDDDGPVAGASDDLSPAEQLERQTSAEAALGDLTAQLKEFGAKPKGVLRRE